ncbi:MAG: hypothetical protein DRJ42_00740 [Deltaproteobacteria bacterium]|nr:MAG: hypothetical protein DRJ42_00740 [Deltaproteobacteria bacterium]
MTHDDTRRRTPLTHVGGAITTKGDADAAALLAEALDNVTEVDHDELTHGFHTYAARMHPGIARSLVANFSSTDETILDPFVGSGTVAIEAMIAGNRPVGVDLNPIALRIASVKTELRREGGRERFVNIANEIAERSETRVRSRVDARAPIPRDETQYWSGHTLKELAGLLEEIRAIDDDQDRRAFEMVFSSIVVKVSRQRSDTSKHDASRDPSPDPTSQSSRGIRKGLPTEFFLRKALELVERWEVLSEFAPERAHRPLFYEGDARRLPRVLPPRVRADLIITSPPYGGTYDYVDHHARRYAWLKIDPRHFERNEVGARRRLKGADGLRTWDREVADLLGSMAAVRTHDRVPIIMLMGDGEVGNRRVPADEQVNRLAPRAKLRLIASASQERPDFRGGDPRREHLLLLG